MLFLIQRTKTHLAERESSHLTCVAQFQIVSQTHQLIWTRADSDVNTQANFIVNYVLLFFF